MTKSKQAEIRVYIKQVMPKRMTIQQNNASDIYSKYVENNGVKVLGMP